MKARVTAARLNVRSRPSLDGAAIGDYGAIDGDVTTYWDEANGGKLYRYKVDLPQPKNVSSISIIGYEHHD